MNDAINRGAIAAGLLAAPFFLSLIFALGALEPGFSHITMPMSMLGGVTGVRGLVFNAGVATTGILVIVFAFGLHRQLPLKITKVFGFGLLVFGGLGLIGAGYFHCNEGCRNISFEPDIVGQIHIVTSLLAGMSIGIAPFFMWAAMRGHEKWQRLVLPTLAAAVLANLPGMTFWVTFLTGYRMPSIEGLIQRLGLMFVLVWMFYVALHLWMQAFREDQE